MRQDPECDERYAKCCPYTLHSTPYTLHPTPYTPHPTPHTLTLNSYTLHPTPYALHPTPYTPHPTPYTLHSKQPNPKPQTGPAPESRHLEPETRNPKLLIRSQD